MELASWGRRAVAATFDFLIVGLITAVVLAALGVGVLGINGDDNAGVAAWILAALLSVVSLAALWLLYAPLLMARAGPRNGMTFGKQLLGIRVTRDNGEPFGFWAAVLREVVVKSLAVGIAASIIPVLPWLLDVFWPLWDDENRALHDIAVATHVHRV